MENHNDRLDKCLFGRTLSVSHHLPFLGRLPPCEWFRWPPARCAAGLVFLWGGSTSGRPPPSADGRTCVRHRRWADVDFGDTRWHQRIRPRWCCREHATTGTDQTRGPRPVTLSSQSRPLLAVSGSLSGQRRCRRKVSGLCVVACHCGCTEDWGSLSRLSPPAPAPRGGRGHTCRARPRACSVSASRNR